LQSASLRARSQFSEQTVQNLCISLKVAESLNV
jgi:hypothetical protein